MEKYYDLAPGDLIRVARDDLVSLGWPGMIALLVFVCVATRLITGFQSRARRAPDGGQPRPVRTVPYWIPWLGHGPAFAWNHVNLIQKARESMKEPVFGILMGGTQHQVVVSPSLVKSVFAARGTNSTDLINYALEKIFGDRGVIRTLNAVDHHALNHSLPNLLMREPFLSEGTTAATRLIEREVPNLVTNCQSIVDQTLWERGSQAEVVEGEGALACEVNLFALIRRFVGHITTAIFMGESLVEVYPTLLEDVFTLDNQFVPLSMGIPRLAHPGVSAAHASRKKLLAALTAYHHAFVLWDDGIDPGLKFRDLDDISGPVKERIRKCKGLGLSARASAPVHLSLLWAMNGNSPNAVFWHLLRIYADPSLLKTIRKEIAPYVKISRPTREETGFPFQEAPKVSIDAEGLVKSCLLLKASFYETLRMDSAPVSFRGVTSDYTITESAEDAALDGVAQPRSYEMKKGDSIAIPHAVIHNDPHYFSKPGEFDPSRFIATDPETGEKKTSVHTIKPFGGGVSGCKGRAFAERKLLAFAAAIVAMWDIEPVQDGGFTIPDHRQSGAAYLPTRDVRVRMKQRV